MALQLPPAFEERMKSLLQEQYDRFLASYNHKPFSGLRVNTLKISVEDMITLSPWQLKPIPWCPTGFYTETGDRPGRHPYYHAGLYYIQEPSAMAPVELLDVQPGERVLDLCAAPGGKSTQIAAKLKGQGLLVSNDLNAERTKALAKNLELYGVRNGVVLQEHPDRIAGKFPYFFDKILVDAPCSGEGMFRKDEDMVRQWNADSPAKYAAMQRDILRTAAGMLKPGGRMVYSTCTFSPEENEAIIAEFLAEHEHFHVQAPVQSELFAKGETAFIREHVNEAHSIPDEIWEQAEHTARLWPHLIEGEGHFLAVLQHDGTEEEAPRHLEITAGSQDTNGGRLHGRNDSRSDRSRSTGKKGKVSSKAPAADQTSGQLEAYGEFIKSHLSFEPGGYTIVYGQHVYQSPLPSEALDGLKVVRPGWYMGDAKNGRFVPAHPLATALHPHEFKRVLALSSESGEAVRYLKGETLDVEADRVTCYGGVMPKGYVLVCIDGYSAGFGKWQDGFLKNEYPAGWRWTSV
ncbi:RsmB/NOP family class I SAM-dependent RNA methyltransferase [Paenibacillus sp. KQZ6P-2]|uniref:RsmB/NOP family class I SAM-dependent RNA methyltransferase n=1 Tax=Paenibacillus mangrovi TaxID=2931978 RepID=A0A9X1WJZ0_9BACL|nr:RsmB/NOP family class I SAM-dependent RNA methyltransferase [Paenibacillus mangrovi]MCJ8010388.1 RsmB/NOP family class I SAM-dependent RNA methyltransferase [Paenibacillus mangrovi]